MPADMTHKEHEKERDNLAETRAAREDKQPYASETEDRETEKTVKENPAAESHQRSRKYSEGKAPQ